MDNYYSPKLGTYTCLAATNVALPHHIFQQKKKITLLNICFLQCKTCRLSSFSSQMCYLCKITWPSSAQCISLDKKISLLFSPYFKPKPNKALYIFQIPYIKTNFTTSLKPKPIQPLHIFFKSLYTLLLLFKSSHIKINK